MSGEIEFKEFGLKRDGYTIKPPVRIRDDLIEALKTLFGNDVNSSSSEPQVKILQAIATEIGFIYQDQMDVYNSAFRSSATGNSLKQHLLESGLEEKPASKATTVLKFTRPGAAAVNISVDTEIGDSSGSSDKVFRTTESADIPAVFAIRRAYGSDYDKINFQNDLEYITGVQKIGWINSQADQGGTSYVEDTDWEYTPGSDEIHWISGTRPAAGVIYYAGTITGVSILVKAEAAVEGTGANLPAGSLIRFAGATPAGITSVTNISDIVDGRDDETEEQSRARLMLARFTLKNANDMLSWIINVPGVRAARVTESQALPGAFRVLVDSVVSPIPAGLFRNILSVIEEKKPVSTQPYAVVRVERGTGDYDYLQAPFVNVWGILLVSDKIDGSSPYERDVDYRYLGFSDVIQWLSGGNRPYDYYYVFAFKLVDIAFQIELEISASVELKVDNNLSYVETVAIANIIDYIDSLSISGDFHHYKASNAITNVEGIKRLHELKYKAVIKVVKGTNNGSDSLPIFGGLLQVIWVSDALNGDFPYIECDSGDTGTAIRDYYVDISPPKINWSKEIQAVNLKYNSSGTSCILRITRDRLITTCAGAPGDDLDIDLTSATTLADVKTIVDATAAYSWGYLNSFTGTEPSSCLKRSYVADIKPSAYAIPYGDEPPTGAIYYAYIEFSGDLMVDEDEVTRFKDLSMVEV